MLLYNITTIVEHSSADEWLNWMQAVHIPSMMDTQLFSKYKILKVVDSPNEGLTYCVQFITENQANYDTYLANYADALHAEIAQKFEGKLVTYRTLMEYI